MPYQNIPVIKSEEFPYMPPAGSKWIATSFAMPKKGQLVLLCWGYDIYNARIGYLDLYALENRWTYDHINHMDEPSPTFWLAIPTQPQDFYGKTI